MTATVSTTVESLPSGSEQRNVILGENSPGYTAEGEIISTQTVSSKTRTVETITVSHQVGKLFLLLEIFLLIRFYFIFSASAKYIVQNRTRWHC